ncbi:hypothetical protein N7468_009041 [Penicillium chermesinum]|uniref:Nucleoporin NUP37 n=1 Tax=Penicillium chermesinum TaxID=63820 RepID=A0A9W9NH23_9EURO|nr:uncharacterized protein N7468_009041 [Penicillium chermesinum]KAJ5219837.1 hypothetical protein N7468_009041 [Penicillium chermesinum]
MPSFPTKPLVRPREDGLQLSYKLSHRVHAAQGYPLRAPNGASIIVYGNENGLKVVWRGGRQFSALQKFEPARSERNAGNNDDSVMILDSDDEDAPDVSLAQEEPRYDFVNEETEVDPSSPYEPILRQIDIPLGSRVLHLAIPRVTPEESRSPLDPFPPIAKTTIVIAAVCSDFSTRIVTLPLRPPHPEQTNPKDWHIQSITLNGGVTHQDIPRGVSLTFTCELTEEDQNPPKARSRAEASGQWSLVVATHSAEGSGLLLVHRISTHEEPSGYYTILEDDLVSQKKILPSPAQTIAFNPSTYPSTRHAHLLVAFHSGCVKIFSCFSIQRSSRSARRASLPREELETIDGEGRWLISLYPGFEQSPTGLSRRKTIIDAAWVLGGRAVMVLLMDGEWGIWDIEGAGPGTVKGPLHRQTSVQGVSGGSLTTYAVSGRIASPPSNTQSEAESRPRFAPMTPSTKRVREDTFLKGSMIPSSPSLRGQISVLQTNPPQDALPDESILLRHGRLSAMIPSLLSLWRNAVRTTGTMDASNRCRVTPFQDGPNAFDVLVASEHHLIILAPRLIQDDENVSSAMVKQEAADADAERDQAMLQRGDLDVEGMGRLINGMVSGSNPLRVGSPVKRTRVFT